MDASTTLHDVTHCSSPLPAGITTLLSPVSISGDLSAGRVNGVTLTSDLLTADTEQTVTSRLRLRSLRVTLDLVTDWVNGLDLSREVVRTAGQPATVAGQGSARATRRRARKS